MAERVDGDKKKIKIIIQALLFSLAFFCVFIAIFLSVDSIGRLFTQDGTVDNPFVVQVIPVVRVGFFLLGALLFINKFYFKVVLCFFIKYKRELVLLLIVTIICLLLTEIVFIYIQKYNFTPLVFAHKSINYTNYEFNASAQFNQYGFRESDMDIAKRYKIAVVGDSFVFGAGVEENETFEHLLGLSLMKSHDVGVYNLGMSGLYPYQYLQTIEEMWPVVRPDMIIIVYNFGNDITCERKSIISEYFFPNLRFVLRRWLFEYLNQNEIEKLIETMNISESFKDLMRNGMINPYLARKVYYFPNMTKEYQQQITWFEGCNENKEILQDIENTVAEKNAKLLIVLIPNKYQVSNVSWKVQESFGLQFDNALLTDRKLQDSFLVFCHENEISCLDLLPYLKQSNEEPSFIIDGHFNRVGHMITATAIASYLEEHNLISEE